MEEILHSIMQLPASIRLVWSSYWKLVADSMRRTKLAKDLSM